MSSFHTPEMARIVDIDHARHVARQARLHPVAAIPLDPRGKERRKLTLAIAPDRKPPEDQRGDDHVEIDVADRHGQADQRRPRVLQPSIADPSAAPEIDREQDQRRHREGRKAPEAKIGEAVPHGRTGALGHVSGSGGVFGEPHPDFGLKKSANA